MCHPIIEISSAYNFLRLGVYKLIVSRIYIYITTLNKYLDTFDRYWSKVRRFSSLRHKKRNIHRIFVPSIFIVIHVICYFFKTKSLFKTSNITKLRIFKDYYYQLLSSNFSYPILSLIPTFKTSKLRLISNQAISFDHRVEGYINIRIINIEI